MHPDRHFLICGIILAMFIILAITISPKVNSSNRTTHSSLIINSDRWLFLEINNSHYSPLNQFMIWLTQFGKELFWSAAAIILFVFGGMLGKKTASLIAVAMIVIIPIGYVAKEIIAR